jgi:hypothetical protein
MTHLQRLFISVDLQLILLQEQMNSIMDGTRKKDMCEWWLKFIEAETDEFLSRNGYVLNCLPYNYTDEAPKDLTIVQQNHDRLIQFMKIDCMEMQIFLDQTMTTVYHILDCLIRDTKFTLQYKKEHESTDISGELGGMDLFKNKCDALEKDIEYLLKMKKMDQEIQKQRKEGTIQPTNIEMTDVVPVGGLIMARLHILECELRTALELWAPIRGPNRNSLDTKEIDLKTEDFERFTGVTSYDSPLTTAQNEFVEFALATCPSWAPPNCLKVVLKSRSMENVIQGNIKREILLGSFRNVDESEISKQKEDNL